MIEREIFPKMAEKGELFSITLDNKFWFDIGKPQDYILGQKGFLEYYNTKQCQLQNNVEFIGNVMIHPSAKIHEGCKIGPNVVIDHDAEVFSGVCIKNATILHHTKIKSHAYIENSIISW